LKAAVGRATGQHVQWIRNGDVVGDRLVPVAGEVTLDTVGHPGEWFAVVVRQSDDDPTAFTNAIFVGR